MNSTEHIQRRSSLMNRLMKWPLLCGVVVFTLVRPTLAVDLLWTNDAIVTYPGTAEYPPQIDALNFLNTGSFTVNFQTLTVNNQLFETSDTVNYTNIGTLACNSGFNFDNQSSSTGTRSMSGSFNNSGTVACASLANLDPNEIFTSFLFSFGEFHVWATNIVNSGTVDVGPEGLMQFNGMTSDLSRSTLNMETFGANGSSLNVNAIGSGVIGLNTNFWDPSFYLRATNAQSAPLPFPLQNLLLTNSTAYFQQDPFNNIIRAVFIQDTSPTSNVSYNVYFGSVDFQTAPDVGFGDVTIEWVGSYLDPATGNFLTHYLYLNNDYQLGASTNVSLATGFPDNFTFSSSPTQQALGLTATPAGFNPNAFAVGSVSNRYSYGDIKLLASSVGLSSVANGAITNLPGRIQIASTNELDLNFAQILGPNYLSIQSPNQFDGSAGALIQAPYADINIGVTNGFMTVSNLISSTLPTWGGTVKAWNTRWLAVNNGVTNDYRVLIVGSQLTPITVSQVQDLFLHSTNSIIISDTFNILRNFTADAQSLTVATNQIGAGATSVDGELNLYNNSVLSQSALPNLLNLTNSGAIRTLNQAKFGSPLTVSVTPSIPAVAATGTLSEIGTNAVINDKITIGTNQYVFVKTPVNSVANQIKIGTTFDSSMSNLIAAINGAAGSGTAYSTATKSNGLAMASVMTYHAFTVTALTAGAAGNSIATLLAPSTTATNFSWNAHTTLAGGTNFIPSVTNTVAFPYNNFINNSLISDQGSAIYANNFASGGTITNGINSFTLNSVTATLTNGLLAAGGDVSIAASSLVMSNLMLISGRSLTLQVTNLLTDPVVTNGSVWFVGGAASVGLNLPIKPVAGDLLGTTITNVAPTNKKVINTWSGVDYGYSTAGYTNNAAIGRLILDSGTNGVSVFNSTGVSNALYVDYLELRNGATNRDVAGNPVALTNSANMVIYYAAAFINGVSVSDKLNHKNNDHLRWVPAYAGYFSSTNIVVGGVTNTVNIGLAQSTSIDSDGDGIPNAFDSTPFFTSGQVNLAVTVTNSLPPKAQIQWQTIPGATNYVFYKTNLLSPSWLTLTNFVTPTAPPYAPITNFIYDAVGNPDMQRFYRVQVNPNTASLYGQ